MEGGDAGITDTGDVKSGVVDVVVEGAEVVEAVVIVVVAVVVVADKLKDTDCAVRIEVEADAIFDVEERADVFFPTTFPNILLPLSRRSHSASST